MKIKNFILLSPLILLAIWGCLHFASYYFQYLNKHRLMQKEASLFIESCSDPKISSSTTCQELKLKAAKYPFLSAAEDLVINSPLIVETAFGPVARTGTSWSTYVILISIALLILTIYCFPQFIAYIFWKNFYEKGKKKKKEEYGLIEG